MKHPLLSLALLLSLMLPSVATVQASSADPGITFDGADKKGDKDKDKDKGKDKGKGKDKDKDKDKPKPPSGPPRSEDE